MTTGFGNGKVEPGEMGSGSISESLLSSAVPFPFWRREHTYILLDFPLKRFFSIP